ncbi:MAG: DUF3859 domain-containing protein [Tabrizicola sp.]|nr:DUF3859 domain-containing protein [Tabrizicola sp.]
MKRILAGLAATLLLAVAAVAAVAEPARPVHDPLIADVKFGVLCAVAHKGQQPAPGTLNGFIHLVDETTDFDWPERQVLPAVLGLGFGVRVKAAPDVQIPFAQIRVFRPGREAPEYWETPIGDLGYALAFFSFDTEDELLPGRWVFEGWDGGTRLFRAEFDVVPEAEGSTEYLPCVSAIS